MGEKLRFERSNTGCRRCQLGVCCQGESVPETAGIQFLGLYCSCTPGDLFEFIPGRRAHPWLWQREDNPELPPISPEGDGVEVPALTESDLRRAGTHQCTLNVFT